MSYNRNAGNRWTAADVRELRKLMREGTPVCVMALKLGRTTDAVLHKRTDILSDEEAERCAR